MDNNMTCKELVELITDYLEGKLSEEVRQRVESHLSTCEGCTRYLEQMHQTIRLTGRVGEESLTPQQREVLLRIFRGWKKD